MVKIGFYRCGIAIMAISIFYSMASLEAVAKSSAKSLKEQGDFLYYHGDVDEAIDKFEQAIELEPDMVESHMSLVNLYLLRKNQDKAIKHAREVVKLDPSSASSHILLANLLRSQKNKAEAIKEYETAIALGVKGNNIRVSLGYMYIENNQFSKALNCFEEAKSDKRASYNAYLGSAIAKYRLGKRQEAINDMDSIIKEHGPVSSFLATKGQLLIGMGRTNDAVQAYETAISSDPDNAKLYRTLGDLYFKLGKKAKAEEAFINAIKYDPGNSSAHYSLGIIKQKSNREKEAAKHFEDGALVEKDYKTRRKMLLHSRKLKLKTGALVGDLVDLGSLSQPLNYPKTKVFGYSYSELLKTPDSKWDEMNRVVENAKSVNLSGGKKKIKIKLQKPHMVPGRMH